MSQPREKNKANTFLTNFKFCPNLLEISLEIYQNYKEDGRFLASLMIYQKIQSETKLIMEDNKLFEKYKNYLKNFMNILVNESQKDQITCDNICSALGIIVLIGKYKFWPSCIEEIIKFSKISNDNAIYAAMIFSSLYNAQEKMNLEIVHKIKITNSILDDIEILTEFLVNLFKYLLSKEHIISDTSINSSNNINLEAKRDKFLYNKFLNVLLSLCKLGVNLFNIEGLLEYLANKIYLNDKNRELINEVLSAAFEESSNYQIANNNNYTKASEIISANNLQNNLNNLNNNNEKFEILLKKLKQKELNTIYIIIDIINNMNNKLLSSNCPITKLIDDAKEILFSFGNLFNSILCKFPYLLFIKNDNQSKIHNLLLTFVNCPLLKVSQLYSESLTYIRDFIEFKYNIPSNEKEYYINYFYKLCNCYLFNLKYKNLNINLQNIKKNINQLDLQKVQLFELLEDDEEVNDMDISDISLGSFRKNCCYTIETLGKIMFTLQGQSCIDNYLIGLGEEVGKEFSCLTSDDNQKKVNYILFIESVLFAVRSMINVYDKYNLNTEKLLFFGNFILSNNDLLSVEKMQISLICFLYYVSGEVHKNQQLLRNSIKFLIQFLNNDILQNIVSYVINQILINLKEPDQECFMILKEFYINNYINFNLDTVRNTVNPILNISFIGNVDKTAKKNVIQIITSPCNNLVFNNLAILTNCNNNNTIDIIKEIEKLFVVYSSVIKNIEFNKNKDIVFEMLDKNNQNDVNFYKIINLCKYITENQPNNTQLLRVMIYFLIKFSDTIKELNELIFDDVNNFIYILHDKNPDIYEIIKLLKIIYFNIFKYSNNQSIKTQIQNKFLDICLLIRNKFQSISTDNFKIDSYSNFCEFFGDLYTFQNDLIFENNGMNKLKIIAKFLFDYLDYYEHDQITYGIIYAFSKVFESNNFGFPFKKETIEPIIQCIFRNGCKFRNDKSKLTILLISMYKFSRDIVVSTFHKLKFGNLLAEYFDVTFIIGDALNYKINGFLEVYLSNEDKSKVEFYNLPKIKEYQIELSRNKQIINKMNINNNNK